MCFHVNQDSTAAVLKEKYKISYPLEQNHIIHYHANAFNHPELAIIVNDGNHIISRASWGLIPHWIKDSISAQKIRHLTLNAVSETVFDKPSFRDSIIYNRCIIPLTGFYEWKHLTSRKQPFYIYSRNNSILNVAGIFSSWKNPLTNTILNTFSILTKPATDLMAEIHNSKKRQPIFLDEASIDDWLNNNLNKSSIEDLFNSSVEICAHPISNLISSKLLNSNIPEVSIPKKL